MSDVRHFGAAGDGQTDDTEAIAHAVAEGEGVLEFGPGTYRITRPIEIDLARRGLIGIQGRQGTARVIMSGPGPALKLIGSHRGTANPKSVAEAIWQQERFPVVSGLEILGDHPEADGIELVGTLQCTISSVLIRRCRYGLHLVERNRNFLLAHSHVYDNTHYGVFFERVNLHQTNLVGNHISYNRRAGIKSFEGDVHNVQITGNDIEYNHDLGREGSADVDFEAREGIISEVTLSGNTIQAVASPGGANLRILGAPGEPPNGARLITVSGNVLGSQSINLDLEHVQRMAVSGNTIYDGHTLSVRARSCRALAFSGNTFGWSYRPDAQRTDSLLFEDCTGSSLTGLSLEACRAGDATAGGSIALVNCRDMTVADCQILDPGVRGIWLSDCRRCQVSGNTIHAPTNAKPPLHAAIEVAGTSRDVLVRGNLVDAGRAGSIVCDETRCTLRENLVASSSE